MVSCRGVPPRCLPPPLRCMGNDECPRGQGCRSPEQRCETRCTSDAACPGADLCSDGFCRSPCGSRDDCAAIIFATAPRAAANPRRAHPRGGTRTPARRRRRSSTGRAACAPRGLADGDCDEVRGELCEGGRCLICTSFGRTQRDCQDQRLMSAGRCCVECLGTGTVVARSPERCASRGCACRRGYGAAARTPTASGPTSAREGAADQAPAARSASGRRTAVRARPATAADAARPRERAARGGAPRRGAAWGRAPAAAGCAQAAARRASRLDVRRGSCVGWTREQRKATAWWKERCRGSAGTSGQGGGTTCRWLVTV